MAPESRAGPRSPPPRRRATTASARCGSSRWTRTASSSRSRPPSRRPRSRPSPIPPWRSSPPRRRRRRRPRPPPGSSARAADRPTPARLRRPERPRGPGDSSRSTSSATTSCCAGSAWGAWRRSTSPGPPSATGSRSSSPSRIVLPEFGPQTEFGALFLQEAKLSVTLRHPNLVQVFDFGEAEGRAFLAMEFVHGRTVSELLRALRAHARPSSPALALKIACALSEVLEYLHDKRDLDGRPLNLVHRDVSANNVLVSERGEVKLVDFGVASASVLETLGLVVGKSNYICAEQACGGVPEPGWDIHSLGVLLYEMLTLRQRHEPGPLAIDEPWPFPSAGEPPVRLRLEQILQAATAPSESRLRSARELRTLLERVQADLHPCDLEQVMKTVFSEPLAKERRRIYEMAADARRALPQTVSGRAPSRRGHLSENPPEDRRQPAEARGGAPPAGGLGHRGGAGGRTGRAGRRRNHPLDGEPCGRARAGAGRRAPAGRRDPGQWLRGRARAPPGGAAPASGRSPRPGAAGGAGVRARETSGGLGRSG
ncbi:MAG: serine/threonine-protein kinase [Myxococcales bacterium]